MDDPRLQRAPRAFPLPAVLALLLVGLELLAILYLRSLWAGSVGDPLAELALREAWLAAAGHSVLWYLMWVNVLCAGYLWASLRRARPAAEAKTASRARLALVGAAGLLAFVQWQLLALSALPGPPLRLVRLL